MRARPTLITGAQVLDGSGTPARPLDVLVADGRIVEVGAPGSLTLDAVVLDAVDLTLAPGFIDVHSHADNAPLLAVDDTSKVLQGVTTEIVGNCGFSLAPRVMEHADELEALIGRIFPPIQWQWSTFAELLGVLDERGYVVNYAPLVGHHALRIAVLGMSDRAPNPSEINHMGDLLDEAMTAGAFGLSSGLIYPPGLFCATDELVALAQRLPPGRPYVTHMRGEGSMLLDSLDEAMAIGRRADRPVHVSHLKVAGQDNWGSMGDALARIAAARAAGVDVRQDVYPYTAGSTMLTAALPPWFQEGGGPAVLRRLATPADVERLAVELAVDHRSWENHIYGAGWDGVVIASSASHEHDGRSLAEAAELLGMDRVEALVHILRTENLQVSMIVHAMHEPDLVLALADSATMIGSDGLPPGVGGKPHPRMYGTFPRVLARYANDHDVLTLADAVRRMTSLPAEAFGLGDRGLVAPGRAADLVAFDSATVRDLATYEEPTRPPKGIAWVMVNGEVIVRDGKYLGPRVGRRLRPDGEHDG